MANVSNRNRRGVKDTTATTDQYVAQDGTPSDIHNFVLAADGSLRTVVGPAPYHPRQYEGASGTVSFGNPQGLFHERFGTTGRDILLAHFEDSGSSGVYVHVGGSAKTAAAVPTPGWRIILGNGASAALQQTFNPGTAVFSRLEESDERPGFLTQFVSLPNETVLIIPQGERAYQFDGNLLFPLGYDRAPGPPAPEGPRDDVGYETSDEEDESANPKDLVDSEGYAHTTEDAPSALGTFRLGDINPTALDVGASEEGKKKSNALGGIRNPGEWRAATQWINYYGDLSPVSSLSAPVRVSKKDNLTKERKKDEDESVERLKVQVAWSSVDVGPFGTLGRQLYRTKNLKDTTDPGLFRLNSYVGTGELQLTTLPDNQSTWWADNVPDSWLLSSSEDLVPVPIFRLAAMAFGRLWIANTSESPGMLRPSLPGRYGTFPANQEVYPDPNGSEITALHSVPGALLVFTATSTFLIRQNDAGNGFITQTLSTHQGCVAPNSVKTLPTGETIWLGRDSFYSIAQGKVVPIGLARKRTVFDRINPAWSVRAVAETSMKTQEYRCFVPVDGSRTNNLCVVIDRKGLRTRDDVHPAAVTVTNDERGYMLALGTALVQGVRTQGLWLMDHEAPSSGVDPVSARFETGWVNSSTTAMAKSPKDFYARMRETGEGTLSLELMANYREYPVKQTTVLDRDANDHKELSYVWGQVALDSDIDVGLNRFRQRTTLPAHFSVGRSFEQKASLHSPASESYKLRITGTGDWMIIDAAVDDTDGPGGYSSILQGDG